MRTDEVPASTLRQMVWVFPDRESSRAVPKWQQTFWYAYQEVARELDLHWNSHPPEDVAVDGTDLADPRVYVAGERVTPADTLFVTSLYSLPYQMVDVFNQYVLHAVLEEAGFYLPAPPSLGAIANDKLATNLHLRDAPVPAVPTIRIGTGRDLGFRLYEPALRDLTFPAIVKPTGWGAGWGVCLAHNLPELRGLLSMAQGGETPVVIQPYLGPGTVDYRVYLVDGEPHSTITRTPQTGGYVGNVGSGGRLEYAPFPVELAGVIDYVAKRVPVPYLCVDFLYDGARFWLSEIEPDGAIASADPDSPAENERQRSLIRARFEAYRRGHARWLRHRLEEERHA
jgi:hypothetical protein